MGENPNIDDEAVSDAYGEAFRDAAAEVAANMRRIASTRIQDNVAWAARSDAIDAMLIDNPDLEIEFTEAVLAELKKGEKK